jgi:DNA-binding MarR family transcriptional regulator
VIGVRGQDATRQAGTDETGTTTRVAATGVGDAARSATGTGERHLDAREVGELLMLAAAQVGAMLDRATEPERLSATEARALRYLHESALQRDLAARLGCDSSRVTAIIDRLVGRGYVRRRVSQHDRRFKVVTVTPEGSAAVQRIGERLAATSPVVSRLTDEQRASLADVLRDLVVAD